jgi:hypothetical protein
MATATPLELDLTPAAPLAPEDAAWVRSFVALCEGDEAPFIDLEIAAAREYGSDFARERADIEAGRHPLQQHPSYRPR